MTPQEKAKELIEKMTEVFPYDIDKAIEHAKQCALICVENILSEAEWWHETSSYEETTDSIGGQRPLLYWQQVKTSIESL